MKISYKWLQKYFDDKLPPPVKLAELINAHSFEIESSDRVGDDTVSDVKVMPDRAHYALCHRGIAREVRAITGMSMKIGDSNTDVDVSTQSDRDNPPERIKDLKIDDSVERVSVSIKDKDLCNRYIARKISGIKISESPRWLKNRLEAVGARSINSIVDATNYVMLDIGQPLHAFDADRVRGGIIVRKAKKGEKIELLPESSMIDGQLILRDRSLELSTDDLIIADDDGPLAIAGVKGGKRAEISKDTTDIIIESANFNPVSIRKTSTRLNVRNDSSKRFENEIIPELALLAMDSITDLILQIHGSDISIGHITDVKNEMTEPWDVKVSSDFISEKIGITISDDDLIDILKKIDCEYVVGGSVDRKIFKITPPLDRLDLKIPEDFADEVARIRGYGTLQSAMPKSDVESTTPEKLFYYSEKIKNILLGLGFSEIYTYSLVSKGYFEIEKPLAVDKSFLRIDLTEGLTQSLGINIKNAELLGLDTIKIFEIGKVFPQSGEHMSLAIGIRDRRSQKQKTKLGKVERDEIKRLRDDLFNILGVNPEILCSVDDTGGLITLGGRQIGKTNHEDGVMELDLEALVSSLPEPISYDDLNFSKAVSIEYKKFSSYPFIVRDVAVFVPDLVDHGGVWKVIEKAIVDMEATKLLARYSLFDTFKKDGKTSYAFRMVFQSMDKTLTDDEVNVIMTKIHSALKDAGWEVR